MCLVILSQSLVVLFPGLAVGVQWAQSSPGPCCQCGTCSVLSTWRFHAAVPPPQDSAPSLGAEPWVTRKSQHFIPGKCEPHAPNTKGTISRVKSKNATVTHMCLRGFQVIGRMSSGTVCQWRQQLSNFIRNLLQIKHKRNQSGLLCKPGIFLACCWPAVTKLLPDERNNHR